MGSTGGKQRQDSNTTLFPLGQHKNQRTQVLDINDEFKKKKNTLLMGRATEKVAEQIFLKSWTEGSGIIAQYIW